MNNINENAHHLVVYSGQECRKYQYYGEKLGGWKVNVAIIRGNGSSPLMGMNGEIRCE